MDFSTVTANNKMAYIDDGISFSTITIEKGSRQSIPSITTVDQSEANGLTVTGRSLLETFYLTTDFLTISVGSEVKAHVLNLANDLTLTGADSKLSAIENSYYTAFSLVATAANISIGENTQINADGTGYAGAREGFSQYASGGYCGYTVGFTSTGGSCHRDRGGSHGGYGGGPSIPTPYGNLLNPTEFGSGGGIWDSSGGSGGDGGGYISLTLTGTLTLNGLISANGIAGNDASYGTSGGAGGSIYIETNSILSNAGTPAIEADGGDAPDSVATNGAGGGGRIAIFFNNVSGVSLLDGTIHAYGGEGKGTSAVHGGAGTVYVKENSDPGVLLLSNGSRTPYFSTPAPLLLQADLTLDQLIVKDGALFTLENTDNTLTVNTTLLITNGGSLTIPTNNDIGYGPWVQFPTPTDLSPVEE